MKRELTSEERAAVERLRGRAKIERSRANVNRVGGNLELSVAQYAEADRLEAKARATENGDL